MSDPDQPAEAHKRSQRNELGALALIAVLAVACMVYFQTRPRSNQSRPEAKDRAIGRKLAQLSLVPLTANTDPLTLENLHNRIVLIHFWDPAARVSREQFADLVKLEQKFRDQTDFHLVSVPLWPDENDIELLRTRTAKFLSESGAEVPTYTDPTGSTLQAVNKLTERPFSFPTTLILDREGVVRGHWEGYESDDLKSMDRLIAELLIVN